jgi:hypothetical protein
VCCSIFGGPKYIVKKTGEKYLFSTNHPPSKGRISLRQELKWVYRVYTHFEEGELYRERWRFKAFLKYIFLKLA